MKNSLRQAMAWLHTWSGLIAGWLLFVIFVGGTIACFDRELDDWSRPPLHDLSGPQPTQFDAAFARVREHAPDAHVWWAHVSGERKRGMEAFWFNDDGSEGHVLLDPRDGSRIPASGPGQFFFELHYDLHAGLWGMYLVGFTGMLMMVALVAGVITHKKIFKDFFMLRWRGGGQRAWLDGHNLAGVLGLPFHLMIAYTGVAIFAASYIFGGTQAAYGGDVEKFYEEAGGFYERPEVGRPLESLHSVDALVADAQRRMGVRVEWASVHHPADASALISFGTDHARRVAWDMQQVHYDAATGAFVHQSAPATAGYDTYAFLGGLHMAQFGGAPLRWLYFVLGLAGCVMLATGMQVWVRKREQRVAAAHALSGYGLVRALNVGVVAGMPFACAAMLVANRLLPASLDDRAGAEVMAFCLAWAAAAAWGAVRERSGQGWRDLFAATALAMAAIPLANLATAPHSHLFATAARGEWALAAVDLTALGFAIAFVAIAHRAHRRLAPAAAAPRAAAARAGEEGLT
ncbi:PepSY domain-containing protein [Luteimonas sp. SJ-92]|uniref:PepSY domain-containing protein n=1 Tax=Luteimonas salinisoli TaxID=2752307 RepID=A0A853J956_9GAMM|nr:PepSY-associated TM helix domain-containing protein [Luteimonas salinisoli]NZA25180.1 PepSY domain-containing protein [Luteimonas salinisoli]